MHSGSPCGTILLSSPKEPLVSTQWDPSIDLHTTKRCLIQEILKMACTTDPQEGHFGDQMKMVALTKHDMQKHHGWSFKMPHQENRLLDPPSQVR